MATSRQFYYLNGNASGVVYVDSFAGSDVSGNGSATKPYKTINYAYSLPSKPATIRCRGVFSEDLHMGMHGTTLVGDWLGGAIFDGLGIYDLCGFALSNFVVLNTTSAAPAEACYSSSLNGQGAPYAGVGRASYSLGVGIAGHVHGVAGSSVILNGCKLYFGCIGGTTAVQRVVYANLKHNSTYKICYQNQRGITTTNCTVYNLDKADVRVNPDNAATQGFSKWLFAKAAVVVNNQTKTTYSHCVFTGDCQFVYISGSTVTELTSEVLAEYSGDNLGEKIVAYVTAQGAANIRIPVFEECVFSSQTAAQVLNDPDNNDFTIVPNTCADFGNNDYAGALPPALRVPIYGDAVNSQDGTVSDSDEHAACWDNRTATGCVTVSNGKIVMDDTPQNTEGSILSKIITISPLDRQINAIYSLHEPMMASRHALMNDENIFSVDPVTGTYETYGVGDTVPSGIYYVKGVGVLFSNDIGARAGECVVLESSLTFTKFNESDVGTPILIKVVEPNTQDVVYVRCRTGIYATVKSSDTTLTNVLYLNTGQKNLTFRGRIIVPGESFYGHDGDSFTVAGNDTDYEVAVIFDDRIGVSAYGSGETGARLVPESDKWVPAGLMGSYFVSKTASGAIDDCPTNGYPYGSGNYMTWKNSRQNSNRSHIDRVYTQFKFVVRRYDL